MTDDTSEMLDQASGEPWRIPSLLLPFARRPAPDTAESFIGAEEMPSAPCRARRRASPVGLIPILTLGATATQLESLLGRQQHGPYDESSLRVAERGASIPVQARSARARPITFPIRCGEEGALWRRSGRSTWRLQIRRP